MPKNAKVFNDPSLVAEIVFNIEETSVYSSPTKDNNWGAFREFATLEEWDAVEHDP
jgi:hypothetical protein